MRGPFYVYILTNRTRVLYTGMTNNLKRRVFEHQHKMIPGFTAKYNVGQLVWFEKFDTAEKAIATEKKIKGWLRSKKIELIQQLNPRWKDLSLEFDSGVPAIDSRVEPLAIRKSSGSREVLRFAQDDGAGK